MMIVTGGAGFIGSALVWKLNETGIVDILVADRMGHGPKWKNLAKRQISHIIHKERLFDWLELEGSRQPIEAIFHMGASSSTTETDVDYLMDNNVNYSIALWRYCTDHKIPFIYASSAATYGDGEQGYVDDMSQIPTLRPLNPYGFSKQLFDAWVLKQTKAPPFWAGLKFFNVYGPQEYHKGGQASVIFQFVPQVKAAGGIKLFKSYRNDVADGEQKRDFVYVKDCVRAIQYLYEHGSKGKAQSGIYNIGSGQARSFVDLARIVLSAMDRSDGKLEFVDMPAALRGQYQYFTQASLAQLKSKTGFEGLMTGLEEGVTDYVQNYLLSEDPYL